jgi:hypothetical protein
MRIDNGATNPPTNPPTDATNPPTHNQLVNEHNQPADQWLIELCDDYLSQLHAGSWGRTFYITNDDGRRTAAEFLATTIEGVNNAKQQRSTRR